MPRLDEHTRKRHERLRKAVREPSTTARASVEAALRAGADPLLAYKGKAGYVDWTPFDTAIERSNIPALEAMWEHLHRLDSRGVYQRIPLSGEQKQVMAFRAARLSTLECLQWLLEKDPSLVARLKKDTLLLSAMGHDRPDDGARILTWLLSEGWNPNRPIILAAAVEKQHLNPDAWRLLLAAGADPDATDEHGHSASRLLAEDPTDPVAAPVIALVEAHRLQRDLPEARTASRLRL